MKPGPKNKGPCPADLRISFPRELQSYIDSLGPGRYQDKILNVIRCAAQARPVLSPQEIQGQIITVQKEIIRLTALETDLKRRLDVCGIDSETMERIYQEIHKAVHPEFKK